MPVLIRIPLATTKPMRDLWDPVIFGSCILSGRGGQKKWPSVEIQSPRTEVEDFVALFPSVVSAWDEANECDQDGLNWSNSWKGYILRTLMGLSAGQSWNRVLITQQNEVSSKRERESKTHNKKHKQQPKKRRKKNPCKRSSASLVLSLQSNL